MSKLNDILDEALTKLTGTVIEATGTTLEGRVVVAYNETDLLDLVKGIRSFPAIGIVYEGMRSQGESTPTLKVGISCEVVISFVLIDQGDAIQRTQQKKTRAIDYLEAMRDSFLDKTSNVTRHKWHFLVEAPAELRSGMVAWSQRWSLPVQLAPKLKS